MAHSRCESTIPDSPEKSLGNLNSMYRFRRVGFPERSSDLADKLEGELE